MHNHKHPKEAVGSPSATSTAGPKEPLQFKDTSQLAKKRPQSPSDSPDPQPVPPPSQPRPKPAGQARPPKQAKRAAEGESAGQPAPQGQGRSQTQKKPQGQPKPGGQARPQGQPKPQGQAKRSSEAKPAKPAGEAKPPATAKSTGQRKPPVPAQPAVEPKAAGQAKPPAPPKPRAKAKPPVARPHDDEPAPVGYTLSARPPKPASPAAPAIPSKPAGPVKGSPPPKQEAPPKKPAAAEPPAPPRPPKEPRPSTPPARPERGEGLKKPAAPRPPKAAQPSPAKAAPPKPEPAAPPFGDLTLSKAMRRALELAGYTEPTPIQAGLVPKALDGIDVMGQARTGTGKTAAFAIPIIELIDDDPDALHPAALVLVPTRELAVQTRDEFLKLAVNRKLRITAVYGGKPIRQQTTTLRQGTDIIVGTPGRVLDHMGRRTLDLSDIEFVVLDEADRMLDIGFRPDIEKILRQCPTDRQTLLLSATIPPAVQRLAQRYMRDPETVDYSPTQISVETIDQFYFTVDAERKFELLVRLVKREDARQAIIFCRTKRGADKVHDRLSKKIEGVDVIHGDLPQPQRDRVMRDFRDGNVRYLVATDVVGRGIDVTRISHIINYDIPEFCDDYVHRVGRTGRMGREGVAYTFVTPAEGIQLTRIEVRINLQLQRQEMPDFIAYEKRTAAEPSEEPEEKPVYGRPRQRFRRAL